MAITPRPQQDDPQQEKASETPSDTDQQTPAGNGDGGSAFYGAESVERAALRRRRSDQAYSELPAPHVYDSSLGRLRAVLFGKALRSASGHQKLPKLLALPIFSSDALSSVAYATEAILGTLILVGTGALHQSIWIAVAICLLIIIVAASYRQVIFAYPNGGGAYPVAMENLGPLYALCAGASLLVDYILTVAVSVASGIDAISSFSSASQHWLADLGTFTHAHTIGICVLATLVIMLANLRGVRESGTIFAFPAYIFILSFVVMIVVGTIDHFTGHLPTLSTGQVNHIAAGYNLKIGGTLAGVYLVLQAFSSGCSALTGMEAISNTTPVFMEPRAKNAADTMSWMAGIAVFFFFGITWLASVIGAMPIDSNAADYQTVISQIAHRIFDGTFFAWFYFVVQLSTAVILILAANTAFSGFPQLTSMLARDGYLPRQLASLGDRLVYANGIILLALVSCLLLVIFHGDVYELIPLYAVGVFTSFTIAQSGMVRHWLAKRTPGWNLSIALNALGAVATAAVALIFVASKWASGVVINPSLSVSVGGVYFVNAGHIEHLRTHVYRTWQHIHPGAALPGYQIGPRLEPHYGAWIVVVLIPMLISMFQAIHSHYMDAEKQLALGPPEPSAAIKHTVIVLVPRLHRGVLEAVRYAETISGDARAVYVEINEANTPRLKQQWEEYIENTPLVILASPYRSLLGPISRFIDAIQRDNPGQKITMIVPEFVSRKWWQNALHNNTGLRLKYLLANKRDIIVTNVRYFLD